MCDSWGPSAPAAPSAQPQTVLWADTALRMKGKPVYKVRRLSLVRLSHPTSTRLALALPGWALLL